MRKAPETELRKRFRDSAVELHVLGVLSAGDVERSLSDSDVLLFVRGLFPRARQRDRGDCLWLARGRVRGAGNGADYRSGLALFSPLRKGDLGDVLVRGDLRHIALAAPRAGCPATIFFVAGDSRATLNSCGEK